MLEKIIFLILFGFSLTLGCAPKFCVPRKDLRCMECSDDSDAFCKKTHWIYCDEDAAKRTLSRFLYDVKAASSGGGLYTNGTYKYVCYLTRFYKHKNYTGLQKIVRGCVNGVLVSPGDEEFRTACRCVTNYCNAYDRQPFSESGGPSKFFSPPYHYEKYDENGLPSYCPAPDKKSKKLEEN